MALWCGKKFMRSRFFGLCFCRLSDPFCVRDFGSYQGEIDNTTRWIWSETYFWSSMMWWRWSRCWIPCIFSSIFIYRQFHIGLLLMRTVMEGLLRGISGMEEIFSSSEVKGGKGFALQLLLESVIGLGVGWLYCFQI